MTRIAVILGSTRPGRRGEQLAEWVHQLARKRGGVEFDLIDLVDQVIAWSSVLQPLRAA